MSVETYTGSCHCGAIRFEADLDLDEGSNRCNCSYCAKVRAWFAFAKGPQRFRLLDGRNISAGYRCANVTIQANCLSSSRTRSG